MVYGIESIYEADGYQVTAGSHVGREIPYGATNQEINLNFGEFITAVSGKHGEVIDSIHITVSNGQTYSFGGYGGDHHFALNIPYGKQVVGFYGGIGGHMHNIGCYYK
jgi:hypothetical protein